jgi:hypothetical protein
VFHVCLELDFRKDVEAGQGCVEVCICYRCDELVAVGGPPVGAEDEEGFNVGDQALGNLRTGGRVTTCQPLNLLQLIFKHGCSAAPATDVLTSGNSSWVRATPLSAEDNEYAPMLRHLRECCEPVVVDDLKEVVEVPVVFSLCKERV